jgi:hypothetical protein
MAINQEINHCARTEFKGGGVFARKTLSATQSILIYEAIHLYHIIPGAGMFMPWTGTRGQQSESDA